MSIDIGEAFSEGLSRTFAKNGLILAAVFAGIALLSTVLLQTLTIGIVEEMLQAFQGISPQELDMPQEEYDQMITELETAVEETREFSPLALGIPASVAAGGLLLTALFAEAASIIAVRVFATEDTDTVSRELVTDNILLATLNGFVGGIVVWVLIGFGLLFFIIPGIFLAVVFYFLRQEIALQDKNFVQAMADSWRKTKGNRIAVFLIGLVLVVVTQLEVVASAIVGFVSTPGGAVAGALIGGLLTAFGAAVATRAYVQIDEPNGLAEENDDNDDDEADPYDAALGPDDIPQ